MTDFRYVGKDDSVFNTQDKAAGVVHLHADGQKDAGREENRDENKAE